MSMFLCGHDYDLKKKSVTGVRIKISQSEGRFSSVDLCIRVYL